MSAGERGGPEGREPPIPSEPTARSEHTRGALEVVAAGLLWSLGGVLVKSIHAGAPVIACGRSLAAALLFLPFVRRRPARSSGVVLGSVLLYTGVVALFVSSTKITTAANAILLQYTAPAFVFLLELVRARTRPPRADVLTLAGSMTGLAILYGGSTAGDALGISLAVLSGALFAGWMVLMSAAEGVNPLAMTFANNLGAGLLLLPFALRALTAPPPPGQVLAIALMGTVQLGIPYVLFSRGIRRVGAHEASLLVLVEPVLNPVWVALVVGEVPGASTLVGGTVIVATLAVRYGLPLVRRGSDRRS